MNQSLETLESLSGAHWYNKWLVNQFKDYLKGDILEVGCGIGNFTKLLSDYGKVSAIDINRNYIKKIKLKNSAVGFGDIEKGKYFFKNKQFASIVCLNVLEHIEDDNKSLKNIFKLLKPGGHLILLVPYSRRLYGETDKAIFHFRRYEKAEVAKKIKSAGFKIKKSRILNIIGGIGWFISGKILKEVSVSRNKVFIFNLIGPIFLFFEKFIEPPLGTSVLVIASKKSR